MAAPPAVQPLPPNLDEMFAQVVSLKDEGRHDEAGKAAESLLAQPALTAAQRAQLHRMMVDILFAYESGNSVHGRSNCLRLIEHSDLSLVEGESFDAPTHRMRAMAKEWAGQLPQALEEYEQALAKGIEGPWSIRQHMLQLRRLVNQVSPEQLHKELDVFLETEDVPRDLQFWAAEVKIELFAAQNQHDLAQKFLTENLARFADSPWRLEYDYLRAMAAFYVGRNEEAEPILRHLRDELEPGETLYAQVTCLLALLFQRNGSPETALSLFDDVVKHAAPSSSRAAALLGRAECLAEIERYPEAMDTYTHLIRVATDDPVNAKIDLRGVRESARVWYQRTYQAGQPEVALEFAKFAAKLAPATDTQLQISYSEMLASLQEELGRAALQRKQPPADGAVQTDAAKKYLLAAAEEYLRLAKLLNGQFAAGTAIWQAASAFDLAGDRKHMIEALEGFTKEFKDDTRIPEALLQLGRAHQTAGDLTKAVECYQRNLIDFPRTPAALASLVPLSDCFQDLGERDKAEQTLLRILTPRPGDSIALITPDAPEYQDALFRLGELYTRAESFEKAIARYEEALERYANDPRASLATFHLADSYRKSAARIRTDLADAKNVAFKDSLRATHQQRLQRASEMFDRFIASMQNKPEAELSDLERLCLKLSYLYAADCVYDLSLVAGSENSEPFARSLSMYEKAAWLYQRDPVAMTAYVQIINCYLRLGKVSQAWMVLQRARWALRNIPDDAFAKYTPDQNRAYWENYLAWLEKKPTFASVAVAKAG